MTNERLIAAAQQGDRDAAEKLVEENVGLIGSVTKRFLGRGVESDDLFQLGCVGFLKAVSGFDLGYGTQFSTYAVPKIAGEIRRFLRDDSMIKVSRTLKEQAILVKASRERLTARLGREPTVSELSEATGLSPESIAQCEAATAATESIQQENADGGFTLEDVLSSGDMEEQILDKLSLQTALQALPERERLVLQLRYFHALTQEQTARIIGVSQVQVSRLEKKAILSMRNKFRFT